MATNPCRRVSIAEDFAFEAPSTSNGQGQWNNCAQHQEMNTV